MTHDLTDWQKTVYDALLWLADELRQRDPNVILPYYVEQIVLAAETARANERIVPLPFPSKPAITCREASFARFLEERFPVTWEGSRGDVAEIVRLGWTASLRLSRGRAPRHIGTTFGGNTKSGNGGYETLGLTRTHWLPILPDPEDDEPSPLHRALTT